MSQPLAAVLVGAGNRGFYAYGPYALAHPDEIRFVAVAEPDRARRLRFAAEHGIAESQQFESWEELYTRGQIADVLVNCTLDRSHLESTLPALELGYDVLLEKPMAHTLEGNVGLVQAAERHGRLLMICHVLRYTAFFSALHDILCSGRLGTVVTAEHRENVVYWHMAHSFVRGNWRNSAIESPMILAKCCHDLDVLFWNLGPVAQLSSFGSLFHYRPENAPKGAPLRCTDGCPVSDECPWYAPRVYLGDKTGWPVSVISIDPSLDARRRALEVGPYGRCVYHCDNDVVDHQTINMVFESGATCVMTMHGYSYEEGRTMRYDGTRATLRGKFSQSGDVIEIHDHLTGQVETLHPRAGASGHGGGDEGMMRAFVGGVRDRSTVLNTAREALESHILAFAAEESRIARNVINLAAFRQHVETLG
ncbi:MAG: Gfo/Idh/MocA family oxidoreductase [Chloroflexi bacterium]|nr:Gfo/Idh/MocA family oxidoreductase [Chloroflexota bacterium]